MKFDGQLKGREISRRPVRTDVTYDIRVSSDAGEYEAQIVNLSAMGFRLRCDAELPTGCPVSLKVAKLPPVQAVIRWARDGECGGTFVEAVIL
ncbi:MAG TPA: PilZ domain-containing protein [Sphingomicrobium sp.]|nr:PilZ domain-containing protein [Sphingomicrobium sp.]